MLLSVKHTATSVILRVKLYNSSVTTGAGLTGLTSASSGLIIAAIADNEATTTVYSVASSNVETITTLGTYAAPTSGKARFKEVDATNHPGVYEIHLADARYAVASAKSLLVSLSGATNLAQQDFIVPLGMETNVAAWNGTNIPGVDTAGYPKVTVKDGTGTGEIDTSSGKVSLTNGSISASTFAAGAIDAAALAADAGTEIAAAVGALVVETNGSITLKQTATAALAALAGVTTTGGTVLKDPSGTTTRITATVNGSNERTAITLNV